MRTNNAERQQKYLEKMRSLSLAPATVWVPKERVLEIKSIAARMTQEGNLDLEPSQRQLSFAQFLSDKKGLKVSQDILSSSKKLSEWLNVSKKKPDAKNKLT